MATRTVSTALAEEAAPTPIETRIETRIESADIGRARDAATAAPIPLAPPPAGRMIRRAGGAHELRRMPAPAPVAPTLPSRPEVRRYPRLVRHEPPATASRHAVASPVPAPGDLVSMTLPGVAWVLGRLIFALALAGLVHTADQAMADGDAARPDWLWSQIALLGALVVLGTLTSAIWAMSLGANARRLRLRTMRPWAIGMSWMLPIVWVGFAAAGLMRIDVVAEVDPMPGIAFTGFAIAVAVPYGATSSVLRSLSRRSMRGWWWTVYAVDVLAFGLTWELLASSLTRDRGLRVAGWRMDVATSNALFLLVAALVTLVLAVGAPKLVRERIAVLQARRGVVDDPAWFRAGLDLDDVPATSYDGADRTLITTRHWRHSAVAVQFGAGAAVIVAGCVGWWQTVTGTAESSAALAVAKVAGVAVLLHLLSHAAWSVLAFVNAGRSSVRCAVPPASLLLAAPLPLTAGAAMLVADHVVWSVAVVGLVVAYGSAIASIWVIGTAMANLGGALGRFRIWLVSSALTAGAALGTLVTLMPLTSGGQVGSAPAMMSLTWALLLVVGAFPAKRAMRMFDVQVEHVRQAHRRT